MKKKNPLLWLIPLILLLLLIPFIVPSALTYAGAEEDIIPTFEPVELGAVDPVIIPDARELSPAHYPANPDNFVYDEQTGLPCGYRDESIYIEVRTGRVNNNVVYFAWVQIADPSQMWTFARRSDSYPDRMAKALDSLFAFNADWYLDHPGGVIYRNNVQMRAPKDATKYDALLIDDQGDFHILHRPTVEDYAPYEGHILHSFIFGPALVSDGKILTDDTEIFAKDHYGTGNGMGLNNKTQRQIFCQMGKLTYMIITTEGPNDAKDGGFTAAEAAELAYRAGALNAYNMDGGNSASMVMKDPRENRYVYLNRFGKVHRSIPDLIHFVTAVKPAE